MKKHLQLVYQNMLVESSGSQPCPHTVIIWKPIKILMSGSHSRDLDLIGLLQFEFGEFKSCPLIPSPCAARGENHRFRARDALAVK